MKTNELSGTALDWAVAKCNGKTLHYFVDDWFKKDPWLLAANGEVDQPLHSYTPSTDWGQGGWIIEREEISVLHTTMRPSHAWEASQTLEEDISVCEFGETPLIAAMRCYVASKLGDEVELPKELN